MAIDAMTKTTYVRTHRQLSSQHSHHPLFIHYYSVFHLNVVSKSAYLQGRPISRDVYMRHSKGWKKFRFIVWKLKDYGYGFVESGQILQLLLDDWMASRNLFEVPGLAQLFMEREKQVNISLAIAKFVDDFLIIGPRKNIEDFHAAMRLRFEIGTFLINLGTHLQWATHTTREASIYRL